MVSRKKGILGTILFIIGAVLFSITGTTVDGAKEWIILIGSVIMIALGIKSMVERIIFLKSGGKK